MGCHGMNKSYRTNTRLTTPSENSTRNVPTMPTVEKITIALTKEIADNVRSAVDAGDYASTSEVIREALRDWQLKRTSQQEQIEHLRRLWDAGLKSGSAGPLDMAEIKREARKVHVSR